MDGLSPEAQYAHLLVERSIRPQPGWQVIVRSTPLARPLLEEVTKLIARRGAYPIMRLSFGMWPIDDIWAHEAPEELLAELAQVEKNACDWMDARITIDAPENTREGGDLPPERMQLKRKATSYFYKRSLTFEIPWAGCQYPTHALAQEAGMTLRSFTEFFWGAVLRDWDAERARMQLYASKFDGAKELRIVGVDTDLRVSIEGRRYEIDDGKVNLPGGEFFCSPNEDSANGTIYFDVPNEYQGKPVERIRLEFRDGVVVDSSAEIGDDALQAALDIDEGARRIGELGIGCNPGITRAVGNILFDEKIDGTIHLALGASYTIVGGTNESDLHWDLIKDLRQPGSRIEVDGTPVQEDGVWLV